jgi:hypothetical protein
MTLDKFLDDIDEADLRQLIEKKVSTCKAIEYKECLPTDTYESQKEFLADVSSFANTGGGHLICGIKEVDGVPVALRGIPCADPEREVQRLENLLRDNIQPRCQGIRIQVVNTVSTPPVFILRVPESWCKPHAVNFQGHWRFYARNWRGRYSLNVTELKSTCLATTGLGERIRSFHVDRLSKISAEEVPVPLIGKVRTIFHLIPYAAFEASPSLSFAGIQDIWSIPLMYASARSYRYNVDGLLVYHEKEECEFSEGYTQVYRSGIIESVNANLFGSGAEGPYIPRASFEADIAGFLDTCLAFYRKLSVSMPAVFFVTLVGMQDCKLAMRHIDTWQANLNRIPRDTLLLPEVIIENLDINSAANLKPIFKVISNSMGWERLYGYVEPEQKSFAFPTERLASERINVSRGIKSKGR